MKYGLMDSVGAKGRGEWTWRVGDGRWKIELYYRSGLEVERDTERSYTMSKDGRCHTSILLHVQD